MNDCLGKVKPWAGRPIKRRLIEHKTQPAISTLLHWGCDCTITLQTKRFAHYALLQVGLPTPNLFIMGLPLPDFTTVVLLPANFGLPKAKLNHCYLFGESVCISFNEEKLGTVLCPVLEEYEKWQWHKFPLARVWKESIRKNLSSISIFSLILACSRSELSPLLEHKSSINSKLICNKHTKVNNSVFIWRVLM